MTSQETPRLLADEMLGKLARELRTLGLDTVYLKDVDDDQVLDQARDQDRRLLTRDKQLARRGQPDAFLVESRDPDVQVTEVLDGLGIQPDPDAFLSRCIECNTPLEDGALTDEVPEDVQDRPSWTCPGCQKIYWWGTHAEDMVDRLAGHLPGPPSRRPGAERNG